MNQPKKDSKKLLTDIKMGRAVLLFIVAVSLVDIVTMVFDLLKTQFAISSSVPKLIIPYVKGLAEKGNSSALYLGVAGCLLYLCLYLVCYFFCKKQPLFMGGATLLFGVDTVLMLIQTNRTDSSLVAMEILFHIIGLYYLYSAYKAYTAIPEDEDEQNPRLS